MRPIFQAVVAFGMAVIVMAGAPLQAGSTPIEPRGLVTVRVYDTVSLPPGVMDTMRDTAGTALAAALTLRCLNCTVSAPREAACDDERSSRDVVVRVLAEHDSSGRSACGFALTSPVERGFISLAYDCAVRAAGSVARGTARDRSHPSPAQVLGYVLAHELAHVLMPGVPHSYDGLFSARLGRRLWKRHEQGGLAFAPGDVARLRDAARQ